MNPEFVRSIEDPEPLSLRQLQSTARDVVNDRLAAYDMVEVPDRVVRKLTYTYYHDWETDDPEFVFLLEDPGAPGEHVIHETNAYADLGPDYDPLEAVRIDRRFGARWLATRRYTDFTSAFIDAATANGLIEPGGPWWRYLLSGRFFDDFYMTDVVKYRGVNAGRGDINAAFSAHLIHELEYVEPSLVFAFGKRAWDTIRDELRAEPLEEAPPGSGIREIHGFPHRSTRLLETTVLPLGHPSTNFRGAQLPHDEYMDRFRGGLERVAES